MVWYSYGQGLGLLELDSDDTSLFPYVSYLFFTPAGYPTTAMPMLKYSERTITALERICLHDIPFRSQLFFPSHLTTLSLFDVTRLSERELFRILNANRHALRFLEVGQDIVPLDLLERRLELPHLTQGSWYRLLCLGVPCLSQLSITNMFHQLRGFEVLQEDLDEGGYTDEEGKTVEVAFLNMYDALGEFWPLQRVKELVLNDSIFYEHERNRISLLSESRWNVVDREMKGRGGPVASKFSARFDSLETLVLSSTDESVLAVFYN